MINYTGLTILERLELARKVAKKCKNMNDADFLVVINHAIDQNRMDIVHFLANLEANFITDSATNEKFMLFYRSAYSIAEKESKNMLVLHNSSYVEQGKEKQLMVKVDKFLISVSDTGILQPEKRNIEGVAEVLINRVSMFHFFKTKNQKKPSQHLKNQFARTSAKDVLGTVVMDPNLPCTVKTYFSDLMKIPFFNLV